MSLDSHVQIKDCMQEEIEHWATTYNIKLSFEETVDLRDGIFNRLLDGSAISPCIQETVDYEDEHYN